MSDAQYEIIEFNDVPVKYTEGQNGPLFCVVDICHAFGIGRDHGILKKIAEHIVCRKLDVNRKAVRMITVDGMNRLLHWRPQPWGVEYSKLLELNNVAKNQDNVANSITPDNLDLVEFKGDTLRRFDEFDRRLGRVEELLTERVIPVDTTVAPPQQLVKYAKVPVYGGRGTVDVPVEATDVAKKVALCVEISEIYSKVNRVLTGHPVYTSMEGYRTYKEMARLAGYPELVGTDKGRRLSRQLARACKKYDIQYYLVLDSHKLQKRGDNKRVVQYMDSFSLNAYPQELWDAYEARARELAGR